MKRATIKDIANLVGVNPSTVSRALKDHPDIGVAIREEIKKVAESLNYRPNHMAVNLRQQKSHLIGLIIPEITMFFFPSVIKGIADYVRGKGYQLMVLQSDENTDREAENIQICCENGVEGILMSLSSQTTELSHLAIANELSIPVVLFDKTVENSGFDEVMINDTDAAYRCTAHLFKSGCRNILGMFGNPNLSITQLRVKGFRKAFQEYGFAFDANKTCFVANTQEAMENTMSMINRFNPDGFFCMSDEIIAGVLPGIRNSHRNIPGDCALIGFSDGYLPNYLTPSVSYLKHDGYEVGRVAATRLLENIRLAQLSETPPLRIELPTELITQASTL